MQATQENRQANFESSLGKDELMLNRLVAREAVSRLFEYELTVVSEDENIDLNAILGQHARVELELPGGGYRYFSGHVAEFHFTGFRDNFAEYRVCLRPWLWLLTQVTDNRIFQNETTEEIVRAVCQEHGFTDIDPRLSGVYEPREFCAQYRESDFDFLSRLMEEEGIYYYFEHEPGKHTLVLADGPAAHEPFGDYDLVPWYPPDSDEHREREHLHDWSMHKAVRSGKLTLRDFDFTKPKANLEVKSQQPKDHDQAEFERYDYPGRYQAVDFGERLSRMRLEEHQSDHELLHGRGNARGMSPGFLFTLEQFPRDDQNREYLILEVVHTITIGGYDSGGVDSGDAFEYGCSLTAIPTSEPYRPPRTTPRPIVYGPQTAFVVGEQGEEIWTNEYGQVKVQFHWDRLGGNDQDSSCWVRVSQAWAGKQWGAQFLPRIGQEVVVEFLEGDPDRPLITGSVYNADNMPPYELPANATQSGIKTRSSKNGTRDNYNEIRFEDKKGAERLDIHAEKDMHTRVEHCQTSNIDVNRDVTVGNDEKHHVRNNREKTVDVDETTSIGQNRSVTIGSNDELNVGMNRDQTVSLNESLDVGVSRSATIGVSDSVNAGASIDLTSGGVINIKAGAAVNIQAGGIISMMSPPGVVITHNDVTDTGLMRSVIEQSKKEIVNTFDDAKAVSTSLVATSMGFKGTDISHTSVSLKFPGLDLNKKAKSKIESHGIEVKDAKAAGIHRFKVWLAG